MSGSLFSPSWLGPAVSGVLDRLESQRVTVHAEPTSAVQLEQVAALYERWARCYRVLARHVDVHRVASWSEERIVREAMSEAAEQFTSLAKDYRGFAESRRRFEAATADRAAGGV
ncbi:hypothetical protein AB0L13_20255 [Saccharopolyspora shandongensis]|uniref:hypothetical protein n=1 Tax=Saccharopolyspora shandongensis TaxID=418495 RepID=UPI003449F7AB